MFVGVSGMILVVQSPVEVVVLTSSIFEVK
jgi:hypothetical protein